jgi:hypothetical protein
MNDEILFQKATTDFRHDLVSGQYAPGEHISKSMPPVSLASAALHMDEQISNWVVGVFNERG